MSSNQRGIHSVNNVGCLWLSELCLHWIHHGTSQFPLELRCYIVAFPPPNKHFPGLNISYLCHINFIHKNSFWSMHAVILYAHLPEFVPILEATEGVFKSGCCETGVGQSRTLTGDMGLTPGRSSEGHWEPWVLTPAPPSLPGKTDLGSGEQEGPSIQSSEVTLWD